MATVKDTCIELTNLTNVNCSSSIKQSDSLNTVSLASATTFIMDSNISNEKEIHSKNVNKQNIVDNMSFSNLSHRLTIRKNLHKRLSFVTDIMCILGILGIILMIIENEIIFSHINNNDTIWSWSIKISISFSTFVLIGFIFQYHRLDLSLYAVNNSIEDSRVTLTNRKIFLIVLEILICAIHPMPRSFPHRLNASVENISSNSSISTPYSSSYIDIDVALGLPMFARGYLLCRFIVFHSHLFLDASSRSIGYLNQISINYFFLIKVYVQQWPRRCIMTFCIMVFLIGSWCLRACDYTSNNEHLSMLDSMWLFIITFTTVGYGDIAPSTYCGRSIATIIGFLGVILIALLISVLTQKLLLDRSEKYVHNFVLNIQLAKEYKIEAANIIKFAFRVWYMKKKNISLSSIHYLQAQRRLFQSIQSLQQNKQEQRKLIDSCIDQIDLIAMHRNTTVQTYEAKELLKKTKVKIDKIEEKLVEMNININNTINDMQKTLNMLFDKVSQ